MRRGWGKGRGRECRRECRRRRGRGSSRSGHGTEGFSPNPRASSNYRGAVPALSAASILAALPADVGAAVVRRGDHLLVGAAPNRVVAADGAAGLAALDGLDGL